MKYRVWSHSKISLLLFWKKKAKEKVQFVIYWIDVSLDKLNVLNIVCKGPFLIHYFVLGIRAEFRLMKVVWRWWCYCSKIMQEIYLFIYILILTLYFPFLCFSYLVPNPVTTIVKSLWFLFEFMIVGSIDLIYEQAYGNDIHVLTWVLVDTPIHFECLECNLCEGIGSCYIGFWWHYWV